MSLSSTLHRSWKRPDLRKYEQKIIIAHEHFLNFDQYQLKNDIERRDNVIGYIGRLKYEKGIMNLVKAIPEILRQEERCDLAHYW